VDEGMSDPGIAVEVEREGMHLLLP
jgi:hypothetical protein